MASHCNILAGEPYGHRSLAGYSLWGQKESKNDRVTNTYSLIPVMQE